MQRTVCFSLCASFALILARKGSCSNNTHAAPLETRRLTNSSHQTTRSNCEPPASSERAKSEHFHPGSKYTYRTIATDLVTSSTSLSHVTHSLPLGRHLNQAMRRDTQQRISKRRHRNQRRTLWSASTYSVVVEILAEGSKKAVQ